MIKIEIPDKFALTVDQVAEQLQVTKQTVYKYAKYPTTDPQHIKAFSMGPRDLRIKLVDFLAYIDRNYTNADIQIS